MARQAKYYSTTLNYFLPIEVRKKYDMLSSHNQFTLVCKATSRAEANRIVSGLTNIDQAFRPDFTVETGNPESIKAGDLYGAAISLPMASEFQSLEMLIQEAKKLK